MLKITVDDDIIFVPVDDIISYYRLNADSTDEEIYEAIENATDEWDDNDFYLMGSKEKVEVVREIRNRLCE